MLSLRSYPVQKCPWFFAPQTFAALIFRCHFVGYLVSGFITNKDILTSIQHDIMPTLEIGNGTASSVLQSIDLVDVRLKSTIGRHTLAVCLQPIFFFADWTLLIQFFETWITQGATKFFIYLQSLSPEADELLRVYEADPDIDVERVHWAPLPNDDPENEPNNYVYRGEVVASVNDCVLRSRGQARLVVSSDLDEVIYAYNQSLISLMERLLQKHTKAAAFLFRTSFASFEVAEKN
ncbi:unnamed protein product [Enterobius vermicularis]|uniref:Glycosyltransferase family 92 protein n=1 Tax=Enterobius vermicularis TaxID=51028 RepID=A0A0N4VJM3_ENTVE|nr:unnamed protein product [Enterobius vermicularis]